MPEQRDHKLNNSEDHVTQYVIVVLFYYNQETMLEQRDHKLNDSEDHVRKQEQQLIQQQMKIEELQKALKVWVESEELQKAIICW